MYLNRVVLIVGAVDLWRNILKTPHNGNTIDINPIYRGVLTSFSPRLAVHKPGITSN
jgi:hypothetical protein